MTLIPNHGVLSAGKQPPRIGLLTPYSGTNLGDGAIHQAVIQNLTRLCPGVRLKGITLNPRDTEKRHAIPSVFLTGLQVAFYSNYIPFEGAMQAEKVLRDQVGLPSKAGLRQAIKNLPIVGAMLKKIVPPFRNVVMELRHICMAYQTVRQLDAVIVAGGGQLDDEWGGAWGHPYTLFKWGMLSRLAGTRFIILSVGTGKVDTNLSKFFIGAALRLASYRSYRDRESLTLLGFCSVVEQDPCFPDLVFGLDVRLPARVHQNAPTSLIVGVSPIGYCHPEFWPSREPEIYYRYLTNLSIFVKSILAAGHRVILLTSSAVDRRMLPELLREIAPEGTRAERGFIEQSETGTVEQFLEQISKVDCVVASRLHGVLMSHLLCKPVVALSFDRKVIRHMEDIGQAQYCLDIRSFEQQDLQDRFMNLQASLKEISADLAEKVSSMRSGLEQQYKTILAGLHVSA